MKNQPANILFLFPDQHRGDWLGDNPNLPLRTPNLDRLMARGTTFTQAFTPSPICSPARACLATGRDYERCGVVDNGHNTPLSRPTYYAALRDAGYEVAGVGKFDLHKPDLDWGLDGQKMLAEYGFTGGCDNEGKGDAIVAFRNGMTPKGPYMHFLAEKGLLDQHLAMYEPYLGQPGWLNFAAVTALPDYAYCDNWVAENALRCLSEFPQDKPWHLVVNFVGPHGPFDVTAAMRADWENVPIPPPVDGGDSDPDETLARRQNYAAMIENIDAHLGRMLALVEARGELENTIVVYASDHGEMLGDHGRWGKAVWQHPSTRVPLIVAGPGMRRGYRSDALVALHDVAATFLDCAGCAPLPAADARSLRPLLAGESDSHRERVRSGYRDWRMVFDGRYKLVLGGDPETLLYDLLDDPDELRNLADARPEVVERLTVHLAPPASVDQNQRKTLP